MRMFTGAVMLLAATLSASAQSAISPDVMKDLAPTGELRAAVNFGNGVLAQKGPTSEPNGFVADTLKRSGQVAQVAPLAK